MKAITLYTIALSSVILLKTNAMDNKNVRSKIEEVTVFFQGAELVHSAKAALVKGNNELWIDGLSPNIDRNSVKIKTTKGVVISSFEFSVDYLSKAILSPQAQKLQDEIKEQQKQLEQVMTEIKINNNLLSILQKSIDKKASGSEAGLSIDELIKTMDYYKSKANELEKTLGTDREKEQQIRKNIQTLSARFEQESLKNNKTSGILKLSLSSPVDGNCDFTISYYTSSAGWIPYYDINVTSTDAPIKITSKAKVRQVTGIDWEQVKITLSTAVPSGGKIAPLFHTWFLQYVQPAPAYGVKDQKMSRMMQNAYSYAPRKMAESMEVEESIALPAEPAQANPLYVVDGVPVDISYFESLDQSMIRDIHQLDASSAVNTYGTAASGGAIVVTLKNSMDDYVTQSENQLNISFNIDIPYSIPGNGKEQSIDLKNQEIPATFKYYCTPKLDTETYLLAEIADWQKLNLLNGNANVTYDGTYVGETYIDASSTHQNLSLTLGTDKRVSVKREKMKEFSSTGFLGNEVKQEFAYQLTVRNNQNKAIKMVLKDQYPISTYKEVTVELSKDTTHPSFNKEDVGVVTWEYDMQPGETQTFKLVYHVKYPKNKTLNL
ncbi:MAG: mucoidy inhibitor MuiA family protein [Bacteroidales bacterium]|nr:mucoidy inhibitor MuiA family protein [Bacteroidales bacterium]